MTDLYRGSSTRSCAFGQLDFFTVGSERSVDWFVDVDADADADADADIDVDVDVDWATCLSIS